MTERKSYSSSKFQLELPYLLEVQRASFDSFIEHGINRVFTDVFPITDVKDLYSLDYKGYNVGAAKRNITECRERGLTYSRPLYARLSLQICEQDGEVKKLKKVTEEDIFICELPIMTDNGTFIINGAERVVVSQLHRSPGVSFDEEFNTTSGKSIFKSRIMPIRGSWAEFNTDGDILNLIIDRRRKIPATLLLRALGYAETTEILSLFYQNEVVEVNAGNIDEYSGRVLFDDIIDVSTGEVVAEANMVIVGDNDAEESRILERSARNRPDTISVNRLIEVGVTSLNLVSDAVEEAPLIHSTLVAEKRELKAIFRDANSKEDEENKDRRSMLSIEDAALIRIYQVMHINQDEPPNISTARNYFESLFLTDPRRYDLGEVGRYRLNAKVYSPQGIADRLIKPERDTDEWQIPPSLDTMTMTKADFLAIILYMEGLYNDGSDFHLDDIDHLGNRRVRSIGELLATQLSLGLSRMSRSVRDNLLTVEEDKTGPFELVNVRTVSSAIQSFFGSSQLSQFMDQTNPLAELTNKRRMSALGPGGLTRERAGFEVRDVHHTHYGRLCPIETPEGPNIGLINSLATYTVINNFGFIETPYRIVGLLEYKDQKGNTHYFPESHWFYEIHKAFVRNVNLYRKTELSASEYDWTKSQLDSTQAGLFESFGNKVFKVGDTFLKNGMVIDGKDVKADYELVGDTIYTQVSDFVVFITADEEDKYNVAPASSLISEDKYFSEAFVIVRQESEFPAISNPREVNVAEAQTAERVHLIDVAPMQIVSIAAGLIPFLEHDDANRALMGSNMQRQAVPLLRAEAPIVGTGLEGRAALDSGTVIRASKTGVVKYADSDKIVVSHEVVENELSIVEDTGEITYPLRKFERSNQDTCINQKPIVEVGQKIKAGEVLADGASTDQGELALGKNALIGFLPWNGYNYEDAIIISEELAINDVFTSIHIEEFEVEVRETKRGAEELTRELPNVSEESVVNLDEFGIIREGAEVEAGDILVGKVTPKGESVQTAEERLLLAIFGQKAADVRDTSLRVPPGIKGVVVETRRFSKKDKSAKARKLEQVAIDKIRSSYQVEIKKLEESRDEKLKGFLLGKTSGLIKNSETGHVMMLEGQKFTAKNLKSIDFTELDLNSQICNEEELNEKVLTFVKNANKIILEKADEMTAELDKALRGDELKPGVIEMVKVYVAKKRRLSVGDKMAGRHGNKGVVSKIVPVEDMPYNEEGRPLQILLNPLGVPSRMNVGQVLEVHLSYAAKALGFNVATPVFDGATFDQIKAEMEKAGLGTDKETGEFTGKTKLYDGRTGEPFLNPVTVGYMYMLKLGHLVDDKIHARSIGPYSLVTQQPLGGKSQFGGQRFGEMEVWALEAYGAAYTLQELLTVKSDDVIGRSNVYDAIVKGANTPEPGVPESFRVLIREIRALGLNIKAASEE